MPAGWETELELVRAHAALDEPEAALEAADRARERLAGARDAGALAAALDALAGGGRGPRDGVAPEELSARELEVLAALAGPGSLRQVADALFISRNTIKTHTRALYAKKLVEQGVVAPDEPDAMIAAYRRAMAKV